VKNARNGVTMPDEPIMFLRDQPENKPYAIAFQRNGEDVGVFTFGERASFEGDAHESAYVFFEFLDEQYLKLRRDKLAREAELVEKQDLIDRLTNKLQAVAEDIDVLETELHALIGSILYDHEARELRVSRQLIWEPPEIERDDDPISGEWIYRLAEKKEEKQAGDNQKSLRDEILEGTEFRVHKDPEKETNE
jgi:hypothetical protein